jgi:tripartite-type tricarboxylate transporter receptor subunit TctC
MTMFGTIARLAAAALVLAFAQVASAQNYPTRSILLVVPFAPGGPADLLARLIAQKVGEDLGQTIVVENRPGANTIIGAQAVAKAAPDGYTLLMGIDGTLVMNPFLYDKLAYDPFKDFEPISLVAYIPSVMEANVNTPVNSVKDVIALDKAKPGTLIGVSTPTSQVIIGLFNAMAGTKLAMVPYRGGTTLMTGLLAGDIPLGLESANVALPQWRAGKIKILGTTYARPLAQAPEIPRIADTLPGFDLGIWQSVLAPVGTPKPIIARLHASLTKVLGTSDVRERLIAAGIEPATSASPEEFAAFIRSQADVRGKIIKSIGMKVDQ